MVEWTESGRIALAFARSQRLMRASGNLRKPVLHGIEDQIYPPIHAKLSVNRAQVVAQRVFADV